MLYRLPLAPVRHALPLDSKMAIAARWLMGDRLFAWAVRLQMKFSRQFDRRTILMNTDTEIR